MINQRMIAACDNEAGVRPVRERSYSVIEQMLQLSCNVFVFRSASDTLIEHNRQEPGALLCKLNQFICEQEFWSAHTASNRQTYSCVRIKKQIAARRCTREVSWPIRVDRENIRRDEFSADKVLECRDVLLRYGLGEHRMN